VVVGILLLLAGMTIAAVNFSLNAEKIRAGSRQVQSFLEGARDRAIHAKEPRGVRFLSDTTNPHACTSMVYIAPSEPWKQGTIRLERQDANSDGVADSAIVLIVRGAGTDWDLLSSNGQIVSGVTRIKLPGDQDGVWYTVSFIDADPNQSNPPVAAAPYELSVANQVLILTIPYRDPGTSATNQVIAFQGGGPSTYLLELAPSELPNAERVELPRGIVIDLDDEDDPNSPHSNLPFAWHELPTGEHPLRLDLMFSPRGTVIGPAASTGLIHFVLRRAEDADNELPADAPRWQPTTSYAVDGWTVPAIRNGYYYRATTAGSSGGAQPTWPTATGATVSDGSVTWLCLESGDKLLVSVFTQTGQISSHPVYETTPADPVAPDPYRYAVRGEVAGQ
jgi:hypothetical protein